MTIHRFFRFVLSLGYSPEQAKVALRIYCLYGRLRALTWLDRQLTEVCK